MLAEITLRLRSFPGTRSSTSLGSVSRHTSERIAANRPDACARPPWHCSGGQTKITTRSGFHACLRYAIASLLQARQYHRASATCFVGGLDEKASRSAGQHSQAKIRGATCTTTLGLLLTNVADVDFLYLCANAIDIPLLKWIQNLGYFASAT